MSNYLCKNCIHNNNGWCKERKIQELKNVLECSFHNEYGEEETQSFYEKLKEDGELEPYKNFGKREMFFTMCQQILGMEKKNMESITIEDLKELMINLEQTLIFPETLQGIALDWEVDKDIYTSSRNLIQYWKSNKKEGHKEE